MLVNRGDSVIAGQASDTYVPLVSSILPTTTFKQTVFAQVHGGSPASVNGSLSRV